MPNNSHYSYGVLLPLWNPQVHFSVFSTTTLVSFFLLLSAVGFTLTFSFLPNCKPPMHRLDSTDHILQSPLSLHGRWGGDESHSRCWTGWVACAAVGWAQERQREKPWWSPKQLLPPPHLPPPQTDMSKRKNHFIHEGKLIVRMMEKTILKVNFNMGNCKNHWVKDRNWKELTFVINFHRMLHET